MQRRAVDAEGVLSDPDGWTEHAVLGPWVRQPGTVMGDGSVRPAYFEFKVINELPPEEETAFGGTSPGRLAFEHEAGYLLLSMTEDDFPLPPSLRATSKILLDLAGLEIPQAYFAVVPCRGERLSIR